VAVVAEIDKTTAGRNFCITDGGYVSWVSPLAEVGDEIYICRGTMYPFVAQRVREEIDMIYLLRGDCYIHGVAGLESFETSPA
jgi:hypothetical protein